jgi:putative addiction module component (TIGR02574 family)
MIWPFPVLARNLAPNYPGFMLKEAIPRFDELSASEKLILLEEIWDDLAGQPSEVPVPDWQRIDLERRYQEYVRNPSEGSPWPEVRERLLRAFK